MPRIPKAWHELTEKDVFVINDINLVIPPTNISVQKEDLVYQWRTLRSKATTKLPSGHGQIAIQVSIPFTADQVLDMHRLVVQFRHSPFCYIENRFLRESIVPEWPTSQNMAFTMTSLNIAPMQGSSDTWVMQLSLTWFNYMPFTHNFLYRKDWITDWVYKETGSKDDERVRLTIGWETDGDYNRKYKTVVIARASNTLDRKEGLSLESHREWSVVNSEYVRKAVKSIEDMEQIHRGEVFDLLPMPDRMSPSAFVGRPSQSRIYTRYINLLQRDALKKNFGIDVEASLGDIANFWFSAGRDPDKKLITLPLHRGADFDPVSRIYSRLKADWIGTIMEHHGGVRFAFATYKDIRMPQSWLDKMQEVHSRSVQVALDKLPTVLSQTGTSPNFIDFNGVNLDSYVVDEQSSGSYNSNSVFARARKRTGWTNPHGKHSPVGHASGAAKTFSELSITSRLKWRSGAKLSEIYGANKGSGRPHWGTDFDLVAGDPVFAVAPGTIIWIADAGRGGTRWYYMDVAVGKRKSVSTKADIVRWKRAVMARFPQLVEEDALGNARLSNKMSRDLMPVGTVLPHPDIPNVYFWNEFTDGGQYIIIEHDDGYSVSMHLQNISAKARAYKKAKTKITQAEINDGFIIATGGMTSGFSEDWVQDMLGPVGANKPGTLPWQDVDWADQERRRIYNRNLSGNQSAQTTVTALGSHLHFEYWEKRDLPGANDPPYNYGDGAPLVARRERITGGPRYTELVPVDVAASYERAAPGDVVINVKASQRPDSAPLTQEKVENRISNISDFKEEDKEDFKDLLGRLYEDGWFYYDLDSSLTNVWWKHHVLDVQRGNLEQIRNVGADSYFQNDSVVLTAVAGGLRHVVANIPILGQEFPTQQHLGSIEPYYSFEFCALDDTGELDGLPTDGNLLTGMRSVLQHNSRKFRPITDGWCTVGDSFITRILGSYQERDFLTAKTPAEGDVPPVVTDVDLKRRLIITRATSDTVPGSPGLTCHMFEMSETNPYSTEKIVSAAPEIGDIEEARKAVLQAVLNMKLVERYRSLAFTLLVARLAGGSFTSPQDKNYGKFGIDEYNYTTTTNDVLGDIGLEGANVGDVLFWKDSGADNSKLLLRDNSGKLSRFLSELGVDHQDASLTDQLGTSSLGNFIEIEPGVLADNLGRFSGTEQDVENDLVVDQGDLAAAASLLRKFNPIGAGTRHTFDMSDYLQEDQEKLLLAEIPFDKVIDYWDLLWHIKRTAEMLFSEKDSTISRGQLSVGDGLEASYINEELYELGIEPSLWRSWQLFLIETAKVTQQHDQSFGRVAGGPRGGGFMVMKSNPNWLEWNKPLNPEARSYILDTFPGWLKNGWPTASTVWGTVSAYGSLPLEAIIDASLTVWDNVNFLTQVSPNSILFDGKTPEFNRNLIDSTVIGRVKAVNSQIVSGYMSMLPLHIYSLDSQARTIIKESLIGPIFGDLSGENKLPVFGTTESNLDLSVLSCGYWHPDWVRTRPVFVASPADGRLMAMSRNIMGYLGVDVGDGSGIFDAYTGLASGADQQLNDRASTASQDGYVKLDKSGEPVRDLGAPGYAGWFLNYDGLFPADSPFIWKVSTALEEKKLRYFKQLLARISDELLNDPEVLRAFGLERYAFLDRRGKLRGGPAYPDLDLPFHPYYGDLYNVSPDFYMWNIYEDGGALNNDVREEVRLSLKAVITNCYASMQQLQKGENSSAAQGIVTEPSIDGRVDLFQKYHAEGTDGDFASSTVTEMASPFYTSPDDETNIKNWFESVENFRQKAFDKASQIIKGESDDASDFTKENENQTAKVGAFGNTVDVKRNSFGDNTLFDLASAPARTAALYQNKAVDAASKKHLKAVETIVSALGFGRKALLDLNPESIRLGLAEGPYGQGGGLQYPRRVSNDKYKELQSTVKGINSMFGSRSGYLDQKERSEEIDDRNKDTQLFNMEQPSHRFDPKNLEMLAWQSSNDILSQKMMMRRAYPTFKLYFVEEDEFETRLLNFDDFFSYNGVTGFTVVQNRKSPADHAVITLQNVAGTLDGTKRDTLVDLDYYAKDIKERVDGNSNVPDNSSARSNDAVTKDTAQDQPFGAVVLRPGLNIQLRAGFSNDPDNLHVLISGRVVDVQWNKQGDTAEIMVQSFGVELIQAIKGTNLSSAPATFHTTHQLLGAMMLEPEVMHFGRWEFNQLFMAGEGNDARLDFHEYSREGFLGRFKNSNSATKAILSHPVLSLAVALGGGFILSKIPGSGKLLRWLPKGGKVGAAMARAGVTANFGAPAFKKALLRSAGKNFNKVHKPGAKAITDAIRVAGPEFAHMKATLAATGGSSAYRSAIATELKVALKAVRTAGGNTDDVAAGLASAYANARGSILKAQWMTDPLQRGSQIYKGIGLKPLKVIGWKLLTGTPLLIGAAAVTGLGVDAIGVALDNSGIYDQAKRVQRFFRTAQVSMMLSPQDDNLFPPHPKDYINLDVRSLGADFASWAMMTGITIATESQKLGFEAVRFFRNDYYDKRIEPESARYNIIGTTIWDIFHEMSLRHPGWIYGTRPYGNRFRYTMFFGVPSQRYWSKPANNLFIKRSNDLFRFLEGGEGEVDINEYRRLYGDVTPSGMSLDDLQDQVIDEVYNYLEGGGIGNVANTVDAAFSAQGQGGEFGETRVDIPTEFSDPNDPFATSVVNDGYLDPNGTSVAVNAAEEEDMIQNILYTHLTSRALNEYMRSLELRFVPFRRYHTITSERDIVWNGLMSSENAVHNAVDVTYFNQNTLDADTGAGPVGSALFKAHSFIPEHKLRVMAMPPYRNCRGYAMAMRYGMGQLLHNMRNMYRGEIVLLGNPRIRPWDICIMIDSYNDMVGPVEVEQVVHTFTHETGYITEIKPSAVVFANEISSWPVLEAMKTASVAIKQIEESFIGLRAEDLGSVDNIIEWIVAMSPGGDNAEFASQASIRAKQLFGDTFTPSEDLFGGEIPPILEGDALSSAASDTLGVIVAGGSLLAGASVYKAGGWILGGVKNGKILAGIAGIGTGSSLFVGSAGAAAHMSDALDLPSVAWLLGGPLLMLSCLKSDSIMLVPLLKNGHPIVTGVTLHDPSSVWSNYKGTLGRYADDVMDGTRDLLDLWRLYGLHAWRRIPDSNSLMYDDPAFIDSNNQGIANLSGDGNLNGVEQ